MTAMHPSSHAIARPPFGPTSRGFTLIELMIAITVSLIMMVALAALLVNTSRNNSEMVKTNSQIENGRFAVQLLQSDLMQAGFWGTFVPQFNDLSFTAAPTDTPDAVPAPCLAYSASNWDANYKKNLIGIPLQSYDDVPAGCSSVVTGKKEDTDVLLVRHASNCIPGEANCEADTAGKLYFQSSLCENEIGAGSLYMLDTSGFTLKKRGCTGTPPAATTGTAADKRKFISNLYYIRSYANSPGDGIPTLVRAEFDLSGDTLAHKTAQPLIEGIESFKVELGIDNTSRCGTGVNYTAAITHVDPATCTVNVINTANNTLPTNRGDGTPDGTFVRCTSATPCTAAQLTDVVAVKLHMLVRSSEPMQGHTDTKTYKLGNATVGPFNDKYKRQVFSTTVRLVNVAGRRETP